MSDTIPTTFTVPLVEFTRLAAERDDLRSRLATEQRVMSIIEDRLRQVQERLADMTAEADSWRANARDSGEEARAYKARLAEVVALVREARDTLTAGDIERYALRDKIDARLAREDV